MSKHISKFTKGQKKPLKSNKGGNQRKIGEATAKRMQAKARPKDFNEEIDSDMAEDIDE